MPFGRVTRVAARASMHVANLLSSIVPGFHLLQHASEDPFAFCLDRRQSLDEIPDCEGELYLPLNDQSVSNPAPAAHDSPPSFE
jgi:hypothetical protein